MTLEGKFKKEDFEKFGFTKLEHAPDKDGYLTYRNVGRIYLVKNLGKEYDIKRPYKTLKK